jgi:hypothetical protein
MPPSKKKDESKAAKKTTPVKVKEEPKVVSKPIAAPVQVVVPVQPPKVEVKPAPPPLPSRVEVVATHSCAKCGKLVVAYETVDSATGKGFCSLLCYSKR